MAQKFKKLQNSNDESTAFGKWFATAVYDQRFISTEELAEFARFVPNLAIDPVE